MNINQFVTKSEGEWKSMRSGHSLAFQQFENIVSRLEINFLEKDNVQVQNLLEKNNIQNKYIDSPFRIKWSPKDEFSNDSKSLENGESIVVPIPHSDSNGQMIRSMGYTEPMSVISEYKINKNNMLILSSNYNQTKTEEVIWFISENVRCRSSVVKSSANNSILQTSFASEIRKINI